MLELIQMIWEMFTADGVMIFLGLIFVVCVIGGIIALVRIPFSKEEPWSPWAKAAEALVSKDSEK